MNLRVARHCFQVAAARAASLSHLEAVARRAFRFHDDIPKLAYQYIVIGIRVLGLDDDILVRLYHCIVLLTRCIRIRI